MTTGSVWWLGSVAAAMLARRARQEGLRASRGDERFGAGSAGRAAEGAGGDREDGGISVAEGPDETVQSASFRRLAAAGLQVGQGGAAAARDVALDSPGVGHRTGGLPGKGRDGGRGLGERGEAVAFVPAARRRDGAAGGGGPAAAGGEPACG